MSIKKILLLAAVFVFLSKQVDAAPDIEKSIDGLADCKVNNCDRLKAELIQANSSCVDNLLNKLGAADINEEWRGQLIYVLGEIRDSRATGPLITELSKSGVSPRLRSITIAAIGKIGDISALEVLRREVKGSDPLSAFTAYRAVAAIEESEKSAKLDFDDIKPYAITDAVSVVSIRGKRKYVILKHKFKVLEEKWSPLDLSLSPRFKLPSGQISNVTGLSLGLHNLTASVYGMQAGVYNVVYGNLISIQAGARNSVIGGLYGVQTSLIDNNVEGRFYGAQLGIMYNYYYNSSDQKGYGIQVGLVNVCGSELFGIQAGLLNLDSPHLRGLQLGGVNIIVGELHGVQVGLINHAGEYDSGGGYCRGLQVGLINSCNGTLKGIQIGVLNGAKSNALPWSIGINAGF